MTSWSAATPGSKPGRSKHSWPDGWRPRGLAFNDEKTKIVSLETGYDFLGFNIRRYRNGKLLIKPSKAAVRRVKHKLAGQMRRLRGQNASAVLAAICPITRGWASFYRSVVSKKTFASLDDYLWKLTYKWACRSHPGKPRRWVPDGTSASSTPPGATSGYSAAPPAAPTCPTSPGHPSSGTAKLPPGVPRRPCPDRLLEPAARQGTATARPQHPAPAQKAVRPLRPLRGTAPACPPGAHTPGEWQQWHRTTRKAITRRSWSQRAGHPDTSFSYPPLPTPGNRHRQPGTGIFTHLNRPPGLA